MYPLFPSSTCPPPLFPYPTTFTSHHPSCRNECLLKTIGYIITCVLIIAKDFSSLCGAKSFLFLNYKGASKCYLIAFGHEENRSSDFSIAYNYLCVIKLQKSDGVLGLGGRLGAGVRSEKVPSATTTAAAAATPPTATTVQHLQSSG